MPDGSVWAVTPNGVAVYRGGVWESTGFPWALKEVTPAKLVPGHDGSVYLVDRGGVYELPAALQVGK